MSVTMSDENPGVAEDLPQEIIIIVGCICGAIVVVLTVVLIVLCCKRQKSKQQCDKQQGTRMTPVLGSSPSPDPSDTSKPKPGLDNPGLDEREQMDNSVVDMDRSHDGPFVTNASGHNPNMPYDSRRNNAADAHGHQWNGHAHYDNQQNEHTSKQHDRYGPPPSYPEAQHMAEHDQVVNTEPPRPKKVIYEVVV